MNYHVPIRVGTKQKQIAFLCNEVDMPVIPSLRFFGSLTMGLSVSVFFAF